LILVGDIGGARFKKSCFHFTCSSKRIRRPWHTVHVGLLYMYEKKEFVRYFGNKYECMTCSMEFV
jgi:hypothetical protein